METIWLWIGFILLITFFLTLDLGVFNRKAHVPGMRESLGWTTFWIATALVFNVAIYFMYEHHLFHIGQEGGQNVLGGAQAAKMFFTGYLIEKSLSLDNIFVIGMIFAFFGVPRLYQHRVLFWGIFGAILMRAAMILLGVALIKMSEITLYFFGAVLLYTAIKMLFAKHEEIHPEKNPLVRFAKRFFRVTADYREEHFFVKENGLRAVTPLFLVLLVVESSDVLFAIDSIPAIFAITQDPFLVFTSNVFAILGLRSLYFVMAAMIARFRYLHVSLSVILAYVGLKLMCIKVIEHYHLGDLMTWVSLGVIVLVMLLGIVASIIRAEPGRRDTETRERPDSDPTAQYTEGD
ncbi:MAG TPA: hypothetical protein DEB39_02520 [Planctomycetaceae bacterium]|nr:hypothetical protein [Planctomycetaceae bacterium]